MSAPQPPTGRQVDYVRDIQNRLRLTDAMLDNHCVARFKAPFRDLDRAQVSDLLEEMIPWEGIPPQLRREAGQRDLPGIAP